MLSGGSLSGNDLLILDAATGARQLLNDELWQIREHIAQAGFDPHGQEAVRGRLTGIVWRGVILQGRDRLPSEETHYLWHVLHREEWPTGTTMEQYRESIRRAILDPRSGMVVGQYHGAWQVALIGGTEQMRGPRGGAWLLVEYRLETGHWVTAYQPEQGIEAVFADPNRSGVRWLHRQRP